MPEITTVIVKESISQSVVKTLHPERSQQLLKRKMSNALENIKHIKPLIPPENPVGPVEFTNYGQAENKAVMPDCEVEKDAIIVQFEAKNILEAYRAMIAMLNLSSGIAYS